MIKPVVSLGLEFLGEAQKENGCWSTSKFPGMTALALQAFFLAPEAASDHPETVKKGARIYPRQRQARCRHLRQGNGDLQYDDCALRTAACG